MASRDADQQCKLVILGNGSVGKTSIIARFTDDGFQRVYKQTIGVDFFEKLVTIRGDNRLKLQVWDIGGQSIGSKMVDKYVHGSQVIFLVYDVTDQQSFDDIEDWLSVVHRVFAKAEEANSPAPKIYLIGNKIDLIGLRKVSETDHAEWIENHPVAGGFFMSAQSGENVLTVFYKVAASIAGVKLTDYELAFTSKVLNFTFQTGDDAETRMEGADAIEEEDRRLEEEKKRREARRCRIC